MIIILEGMSTSGKTMIQRELHNILGQKNIKHRIVGEKEALSPEVFSGTLDIEKSTKMLLGFLKTLAKDAVVIFDRFHLSNTAISNSFAEQMAIIEKELMNYDPLLVLLTISEDKVEERLKGSLEHRNKNWVDEVNSRKNSVSWYIGTQKKLVCLFEQSQLPKVRFDTTGQDFHKTAIKILNHAKLN